MHTIDNHYDNAMRNVIPNHLYDADSINLHLIGIGMDNTTADAAYEAAMRAEYNDAFADLGLDL